MNNSPIHQNNNGHEHINQIPKIWHRTSFNGYHSGYITTKIKKTDYGYHISRFSNYISLQSIRLEIYEDGFAKAIVKVNKNYTPKYQYTLYFDNKLNEVKDINNSTRKERALWDSMRSK